jgi:hypothetical protein
MMTIVSLYELDTPQYGLLSSRLRFELTEAKGIAKALLPMVYRFVRNLNSRSAWISTGDFWCPNELWWTSNMCLGVVHW